MVRTGERQVMLLRLFLLTISPHFHYWGSVVHLIAASNSILTMWFNSVKLKQLSLSSETDAILMGDMADEGAPYEKKENRKL